MQTPRCAAPAGARLALALLVAACAPAALAGDKDWKPLDPAHLAVKEPAVEKDADAEVIFCPVSAPGKSLEKRTGKLKLSEDGMPEGDVRIEYAGHIVPDRLGQGQGAARVAAAPDRRGQSLRQGRGG